jgi:hypothetical protein
MSNTNTSFEHVLHNLQERMDIIDDSYKSLDILLGSLDKSIDDIDTKDMVVDVATNRVISKYHRYVEAMERFNIGIIPFITDYYDIIDRHTDQFNFKFLYNYSSHVNHYNPIVQSVKTCKFDLDELVSIFNLYCYELKRFRVYSDVAMARRAHEQTWAIYKKLSKYIAVENIYELSDIFIYELGLFVDSVKRISMNEKSHINLSEDDDKVINDIRSSIQQFNNIKLDLKPVEEVMDYCECGHPMQVMPESSEMVCDNCGYLYELKGTVFNDCQFYSQESIRYKHAGYEPSKHVKSWLERIQARETNTITEAQLMKIEGCIKRDGITNKKRLTIEQLRRYLKDSGLTELNEHVALIKRLITGVAPPQLSYAETQDITNSFAKAVKAYNIIRPSNKSNMLFYPYIVWKLIEMHIPDYYKKKSLLSFIHLQGAQTLIQNDTIWAKICHITRGFKYIPTDRYAYID